MTITTRGWTLDGLVATASNFQRAPSFDYRSSNLVAQVNELLDDGIPVVVTGFNGSSTWNARMFNRHTQPPTEKVTVRNVIDGQTRPLKLERFFGYSEEVETFAQPKDRQRLITTDMEPPSKWTNWLTSGETLQREFSPLGNNDLFRHLPKKHRPVTLMCNYTMGDAYAPWYKDLCGLVGQNLMVHTEEGASAFWFMTGTQDADRVASYFHSQGQELDQDEGPPFVLPERLGEAPFKIFVCRQQLGDLVLFPPRSAQQFIAHGRLTGHVAWSRATFSALAHGLLLELPIYNRIARPEKYRLKLTVYYAVRHYASLRASPRVVVILEELLDLLDTVLISEYAPGVLELEPANPRASYDRPKPDFVTCDSCNADIFISFLHCKVCGQDICSACYVSGRTCSGAHAMKPAVAVSFQEVLDRRNECASSLARSKGEAIPQMTESRIQVSHALQTFRAACVLQTTRCGTNRDTTCAQDDHKVNFASTLKCAVCDQRFCFAHLLSGQARMHAQRAIIEHERIPPEIWHQIHSESGPVSVGYDVDCGDDIAGMYLSAVTRKYPDRTESDVKTQSWYSSRPLEYRKDDSRAQEETAALFMQQINDVLASIRDASGEEPDPPKPGDANGIISSKTEISQLLPPAHSELAKDVPLETDARSGSESSNRSSTLVPRETPASSRNGTEDMEVDRPAKSDAVHLRKRKAAVVDSDDESDDGIRPAAGQKRIQDATKVTPVAKRPKAVIASISKVADPKRTNIDSCARRPTRLAVSTQIDGQRGTSFLSPAATSSTTFSSGESKASSRTTPAVLENEQRRPNPPLPIDLESYRAASTLSPPPAYQSPGHDSTPGPLEEGHRREHAGAEPAAKLSDVFTGTDASNAPEHVVVQSAATPASSNVSRPPRPSFPKFKKITPNPTSHCRVDNVREERSGLRNSVWMLETLSRIDSIIDPTKSHDESWHDDIVQALSSAGVEANNRLRERLVGLVQRVGERVPELEAVQKELAEARSRLAETQLKLKSTEEILRQEQEKTIRNSVRPSRWDSPMNNSDQPRGWQQRQRGNFFNSSYPRGSYHWRGANYRANNGFFNRNYSNQQVQPFQNGAIASPFEHTQSKTFDTQGFSTQSSTPTHRRVYQNFPRKNIQDGNDTVYHQDDWKGHPYIPRDNEWKVSRAGAGVDRQTTDNPDGLHPPSRGRSLTRSPLDHERAISLGETSERSYRRPRMDTHSLSRSRSRNRSRSGSRLSYSSSRRSIRSYSRSRSRGSSRSRSLRNTYSRSPSRSPRRRSFSRSCSLRSRSAALTMESSHLHHLHQEASDGMVICNI